MKLEHVLYIAEEGIPFIGSTLKMIQGGAYRELNSYEKVISVLDSQMKASSEDDANIGFIVLGRIINTFVEKYSTEEDRAILADWLEMGPEARKKLEFLRAAGETVYLQCDEAHEQARIFREAKEEYRKKNHPLLRLLKVNLNEQDEPVLSEEMSQMLTRHKEDHEALTAQALELLFLPFKPLE